MAPFLNTEFLFLRKFAYFSDCLLTTELQHYSKFMQKILFKLTLAIVLFSSCISKKEMIGMYESNSSSQNIQVLNGNYKNTNKGITLLRNESLWYHFQKIGVKEKFEDWKKAEIKLEAINDHSIQATVYIKDTPIDTKILKGKFENGCFIMKRRIKPKGIPLVLFHYNESVTMLTLDGEKELRVYRKHLKYGGMFVFWKGKKETEMFVYKRKKD